MTDFDNRTDLRKASLNAKLPGRIVAEPVWGDRKYGLRGMSIRDATDFVDSLGIEEGVPTDRTRMQVQAMIRTVVDPETGEPLYTQADADTLAAGPRPNEILKWSLRYAGLGDQQLEETVEDLKGTPDDVVS